MKIFKRPELIRNTKTRHLVRSLLGRKKAVYGSKTNAPLFWLSANKSNNVYNNRYNIHILISEKISSGTLLSAYWSQLTMDKKDRKRKYRLLNKKFIIYSTKRLASLVEYRTSPHLLSSHWLPIIKININLKVNYISKLLHNLVCKLLR